jgi:hypothetical protein
MENRMTRRIGNRNKITWRKNKKSEVGKENPNENRMTKYHKQIKLLEDSSEWKKEEKNQEESRNKTTQVNGNNVCRRKRDNRNEETYRKITSMDK